MRSTFSRRLASSGLSADSRGEFDNSNEMMRALDGLPFRARTLGRRGKAGLGILISIKLGLGRAA